MRRSRAKSQSRTPSSRISTGTKNKAYSDVLYIEELIGPHTVNTVPPATLDAFRDHGKPRLSLEENIGEAERVLSDLARTGIPLDTVTQRLLDEGVELFEGQPGGDARAGNQCAGGTGQSQAVCGPAAVEPTTGALPLCAG